MPFKLGITNCYLVENDSSFMLIDTGSSNQRRELDQALAGAGCKPGNLKLIVLTHGDFDHTGNAAYLHQKYGAPIAMHQDDLGMAERGDMFANRKQPNILIRKLIPAFSGFGKEERFTPDILIGDGYDFSGHSFEAKAISIPGHSKGSIGILTASGDLFCGDLLDNTRVPALSSIMDDPETANASIEKLDRYAIRTVYPGHGNPFLMEQFRKSKE
jgi:glyoxylase-like metal-dependent hydrolase (beta-lactamase superfamily II)